MLKFPNWLCGIKGRQLELMFWTAGLTSQHLQDCLIFFIQLNYVHKSKQNKVLPPYIKLPCHKVAPGIPLPFPLIQWSHVRQTLRGRCWAVRLALQSNSSNCLVLIPHWQLGNYLLGTGGELQPNICKTIYKSMFDTYQESTYSRSSTACCTESWCQSVLVI